MLDALLAAQKQVSVDRQFAISAASSGRSGGAPRREPRGFSGQLRDYQKDGLGWLHFLRDFRLGGCLADDMGLGKTVQRWPCCNRAGCCPDWRHAGQKPSLAVVPRSLVFNWIEEAQRFTPNLRVLDYTGPLRKDALKRLDHWDLLVTTYGTLHRDIARLKDIHFDYPSSTSPRQSRMPSPNRPKACRLLRGRAHRLAMTGTPVENHLGELWSLFEFLNPGMLGRSSAFRRSAKDISAESKKRGAASARACRAVHAPPHQGAGAHRAAPKDRADPPSATSRAGSGNTTTICATTTARRSPSRSKRPGWPRPRSTCWRPCCAAPGGLSPRPSRQARLDDPSAKLDLLLEQLAEVIAEGHKALVFSQFTSFLAIVRRRLDAEKIVYEYLDGHTRDRKQRVDRFQTNPACPLFLISLKAGGHGLNLTAADYVFILDPWWNPAVEAQAVDRTHRIGQTRHVFAYRLIARDTVEEKVLELQKTKRDLAEAIISG